uniref:Transmembrane serine protease 2 n=1 Tax=Acanthochromis polyacanthus TaxID=80966 RepID=A0A3Q1GDL0_9TELE
MPLYCKVPRYREKPAIQRYMGRDRCNSNLEPQFVCKCASSHSVCVVVSDVKQRCVKFTVAAVICLLLLLLLAGILLAYYCELLKSCFWRSNLEYTHMLSVCSNTDPCPSVSSPCSRGMRCGDGSCVWESQWCNGVMDCPAGQDEAHCVRLHGSSFLLQIYSTQTKAWRSVCSHGWTDQQGRASCQSIGYSRSDAQICNSKSKQIQRVKAGLFSDCGSGINSSRAPRSSLASVGSWPWQVSLQVSGVHRCGGAIVSPYWIVTAAHCVMRTSSPADWSVYAGIMDRLNTLFNPAYSVSHVIMHEDFNILTRENDVALMRLSRPLDITASSNIGPVCLPNVGLNVTVPQSYWITRFDRSRNGDSGSVQLMEAQVSVVDTTECNSSIAYNGKISQDMFCARETEAGARICHADTGGPLVTLTDGLWWLIGDSIWGEHCTGQKKPGVYGNVTSYLDWIHRHMKVKTNGIHMEGSFNRVYV